MDSHEQDIAALIELLKMEADRPPRFETGPASQCELFGDDHFLLEMWPEACRRAGIGEREFPPGVIQLWQQGLGLAN